MSWRLASLHSRLAAREAALLEEFSCGNVPAFLRRWVPVELTATLDGRKVTATCFVTPDYLAVGHASDFLRVPLTPRTAQFIADRLDASLPTSRIVDAVHAQAPVRLEPEPIHPSERMTTLEVFAQHNATVTTQRALHIEQHGLGTLVAGHKQDVVVTNALRRAASPSTGGTAWTAVRSSRFTAVVVRHGSTTVTVSASCTTTFASIVVFTACPVSSGTKNWPPCSARRAY